MRGGTGYGLDSKLPDYIEHCYPDYDLYGITDTAYGYLSRGCPRGCPFCIVKDKEGQKSIKVADLSEWWSGQKNIVLMDPNITACLEFDGLVRQLIDSNAWIDITQGIDIRLMTEHKAEMLNMLKIKMVHFAWDNPDDEITPKLLAKFAPIWKVKERNRRVYVLTNYNSSHAQDLDRVYRIRDMGYDPYVMIYEKWNAPRETRKLQRWCNNKFIFRKCEDFSKYGG